MTLAALIRKSARRELATAIPAIPATEHPAHAPTVARIATVAVANPAGEKTAAPPHAPRNDPIPPHPAMRHGRRCPADAARWLASVAAHLDTTPDALLAAGVILRDEVPHYLERDPATMADALRRAHPGRFIAREPDDRRHCATCQQLAGTRCRTRRLLVMDDLPRRCADYLPTPDDADQRPGRDRWPSLLIPLEASP